MQTTHVPIKMPNGIASFHRQQICGLVKFAKTTQCQNDRLPAIFPTKQTATHLKTFQERDLSL